MKRLLQLTLVLFIVTGLTTLANAQQISALATVEATSSVTAGSDLDFGTVTPGTPSTLAPASGGTFTVTGNSNSLDLSFTLPTNLSDGTNTLPISFGANSAAWGDSGADNTFNPGSGTSVDIVDETTDNEITVYIGGTVSPTADQIAGDYTGTITLTATYN